MRKKGKNSAVKQTKKVPMGQFENGDQAFPIGYEGLI